MAHDVFISYASSDKAVADAVCSQLESIHRIRCWIAPRDVTPGASWAESIIDALDGSKIMVLIFSSSANASMQIEREVERAVHKGINIIPLRIENAMPTKTLEYFISAPHWLDALTTPLEDHINKLAQSVKALLSKQGAHVAAPLAAATAAAAPAVRVQPTPATPARSKSSWVLPAAAAAVLVIAALAFGALWIGSSQANSERLTEPASTAAPAPAASTESAPATIPAPQPSKAATPTPAATTAATPPAAAPAAAGGAAAAIVSKGEPNLFIDFRNTLDEGTMTLEIDGQTKWTTKLGAGLKAKGGPDFEDLRTTLNLPAGRHKVTATLKTPEGKVRDTDSTSITYLRERPARCASGSRASGTTSNFKRLPANRLLSRRHRHRRRNRDLPRRRRHRLRYRAKRRPRSASRRPRQSRRPLRASPLSLVIGVTGHRDLRPEDIPRLELTMRSSLIGIQRTHQHSLPVLLSALAEGADRLAARVALDLGIQLVAVMPFSQEVYERDFETPESLAEFRDFLARATGVLYLPLLDGESPGDVDRQGPARDREYAKAGAYIAAHSQIFFALWDGSPETADKVGGTAQTVGFRLEGAQAPYVGRRSGRIFGVTAGPVFHVRTPRITNPASASLPCDVQRISPTNLPDGSFDRICERIETFNRDAHQVDRALAAGTAASAAGLLNMDLASVAPTVSRLSGACRQIIDQYVAADALALQFRGRVLTTWVRVYVGVAIAALLFNLHSSFFSVPSGPLSPSEALGAMPWFFIGSLACSMVTATYFYGRAEKGEYHTKYLDYRALAEALRIQFFWKVAGIDEPVVDWYLRKQRSDLEWIRSALRSCDVMTAAAETRGETMALSRSERLTLVLNWVADQRGYYATKTRTEKAKLERERSLVARLLKVGGLLSLVLATILIVPTVASGILSEGVARLTPTAFQHGAWMVIIPMFAVSAGLLHGYGQQLARAEHARQFERMSELFYAAEKDLRKAAQEGGENAAGLVRELGIEALDENGDWLILHRERPLEVPPG